MVDIPWLPLSLVLGVVDHRWLPFSVHLIVPVLGLRRVGVGDVLGLVPVLGFGILVRIRIDPSYVVVQVYLWLHVLRVVELGLINPIVGLLRFGILDRLGRQKVPIVSQ